jgi:outer membrane protein assembly factor BamD
VHNRSIILAATAFFFVFVMACASKLPEFGEVLPADELYSKGIHQLETRRLWIIPIHYTLAVETFQSIIDNYPYSDYAVKAELKIADAYFINAKYDEALSYYRDFADLHPQHEKVPYTILRSALCRQEQMHAANRDQTATRDALAYLDHLLATYPHTSEAREAEVLWRELRTQLAMNVTQIADFYMGKAEYESAAERYRSLLNEYPGLGLDAQALYNLGVCYSEMRRTEEAGRIFQSIVQNYRDSQYAAAAAERIAESTRELH